MERENGHTLLEVVIASAIFVTILALVLTVLLSGQSSFTQGTTVASLQSDVTRMMDLLTDDLMHCRIVTPPSSGNNHITITIQEPLSWTDSGVISWGADNNQGWTYTYQFVSSTTYNEAVDNKDYNSDGDKLDIFYVGQIQLVIKNAGGITQKTSYIGDNVLLSGPNMDADLDGDGISDPLFLRLDQTGTEDTLLGNRLRVNLWLIKNPTTNPTVINTKAERTLVNPQQ